MVAHICDASTQEAETGRIVSLRSFGNLGELVSKKPVNSRTFSGTLPVDEQVAGFGL